MVLEKKVKLPGTNMVHLNGDLLCVVDTETTGLNPDIHKIWQVAVLPMGGDCKPIKGVPHFEAILHLDDGDPIDPKAMTREKFLKCKVEGMDENVVADALDDWFEKLMMPVGKRIQPLAMNWVFDREMLIKWLGRSRFESIFSHRYRDLLPISLHSNDCADAHNEPCPYPKHTLGSLCKRLCVVNDNPHDALCDCMATGECYRKMIGQLF
jgi:DNA polymerase III epsilon subunit-like protein